MDLPSLKELESLWAAHVDLGYRAREKISPETEGAPGAEAERIYNRHYERGGQPTGPESEVARVEAVLFLRWVSELGASREYLGKRYGTSRSRVSKLVGAAKGALLASPALQDLPLAKRLVSDCDGEDGEPTAPLDTAEGDFPTTTAAATFHPGFFHALEALSAMPPLEPLPDPWVTDFAQKSDYLHQVLALAREEIRVVSYSFIIWKDRHEDVLLDFIQRGGRLRILIADPDSPAFLERSALEAYHKARSTKANDIEHWQRTITYLQAVHRKDVEASIASIKHWQDATSTEKVQCRFYRDTPPLNGACADKAIFLSPHFTSPAQRAWSIPTLCTKDHKASGTAAVLYRIFHNWFEVKFSMGTDPLTGSRLSP